MTRLRAASLATTVLLLGMGAAWAKTSDRNQRANIGADSSNCSMNEGAPCVLTGNVKIVQGTLDIEAAKADVRRGGGEIRSIKLNGSPVKMKQQNDDNTWVNATASQIDYDLPKDTVIFTGDANLRQAGRGSISGERIVYNMRTGQVQSGAAAGGGRVNMIFEPKNASSQPPAKSSSDAKPAQDGN